MVAVLRRERRGGLDCLGLADTAPAKATLSMEDSQFPVHVLLREFVQDGNAPKVTGDQPRVWFCERFP